MSTYHNHAFTPEQIRQQRTIGPAGVCRAIVPGKITQRLQQYAHRVQYAEQGEVSRYHGGSQGPIQQWLEPVIHQCIGASQWDFWAIQESIEPWRPHADQRWYPDRTPQYTVLIPLSNWGRTCVFHQRLLQHRGDRDGGVSAGNSQHQWQPPCQDPELEGRSGHPAFSEAHRRQWYSHCAPEWFEDLSVELEYDWQVGDVVWWPQTAIHCASNHLPAHDTKHSVVIMTNFPH